MKPLNLTILTAIFITMLWGIPKFSDAQVLVEMRYSSSAIYHTRDLRNFSVQNQSGGPFQCILRIEITKDDKTVLSGESAPITLPAGKTDMAVWANGQLNYLQSGGNNGAVQNDGTLGGGAYMACIQVLDVRDRAELTIGCEAFSVAGQKKNAGHSKKEEDKNETKKKWPITFHGNAEVSGHFANRPPMHSDFSPNYGHVFLNPTLSVYDVPFTGTVLVSTQNSPLRQNMNVFNFSFDADAFKNNLIRRLQKAVTENKKLNEMTGGRMATLSKIQNLDNLMQNPEVQKELKGLKDLESYRSRLGEIEEIQQVLGKKDSLVNLKNDDWQQQLSAQAKDSLSSHSDSLVGRYDVKGKYDSLYGKADSLIKVYEKYRGKYDSLRTTADSLRGMVNKLKHLDYKKGGYEALLSQKENLLKDAKLNGWVDSLGNVKESAEELSKMDMSRLSDPEYLTQKLTGMGLLKKYEKYLSWVRQFSIGTSFTRYSDHTLNNVPVSGISVEVAPWKLYASFTYGQVQRSVLTHDIGDASYRRNLMAGSFGYGAKEKTHFHITVLSSADDPGSINPRDSVYLYYRKPQANKVIGTDFALNLMKDKIRISGELSGSQLIRDLTYDATANIIELQDTVLGNERNWVANIFRQKPVNMNTVTDFAFAAKAEVLLFNDNTRLSAGASRVGADYHSFGTAFLMRDLLTFEGKVSQRFMKNKISASLYIRQMSNNLSNDKPITVNQWRWGGDLALNFPKMPTVRITYTPILQETDSGTVNMNMMSANVSYPSKVRKVRIVNMLSYIFQNGTRGFYSEGFTSHFTTFNQNIMFPKGQTFSFTGSYIYTSNSLETLHSLTASLSGSLTLFKKWNNGAGVNIYMNKMEQRYMVFYRTGISLLKYLTFNIQAEAQIYRNGRSDAPFPVYDVFALRPMLNVRW